MTSVQANDDIQKRVLATAAEILWEGGLDALTVEEVTKRSGIAKTTIYRRWSGAEELGIRAVKSLVLAELEAPGTGSLRGDLEAHYRTFIKITEDPGFQRVVLSLMAAAQFKPELQEVRAEMDAMRIHVIRDLIDAARERGEVTRDLTDHQISALIEGPMFIMRIHQAAEVTAADIDALVDAICAALA